MQHQFFFSFIYAKSEMQRNSEGLYISHGSLYILEYVYNRILSLESIEVYSARAI